MTRPLSIALALAGAVLAGVTTGGENEEGKAACEKLLKDGQAIAANAPRKDMEALSLGIIAAQYQQAGMPEKVPAAAREAEQAAERAGNPGPVLVPVAALYAEAGMRDRAWEVLRKIGMPNSALRGYQDLVPAYVRAGELDEAASALSAARKLAAKVGVPGQWVGTLAAAAHACADAPDVRATEPLMRRFVQYAQVIQREPIREDLLRKLAQAAYRAGLDKLTGEILALPGATESRFDALLEFAGQAVTADQAQRAASYFDRALDAAVSDARPDRAALVAAAAARAGLEVNARKALDQALKTTAESPAAVTPKARTQIVIALLGLGRIEQALAECPAAGDQAMQAVARRLAERGRYDDAAALAAKIGPAGQRSRAFADLARESVLKGDYDRVPGLMAQVTDKAVLSRALESLAKAAVGRGQFERAIAFIDGAETSIMRSKGHAGLVSYHLARGSAESMGKRAEEAETFLAGIGNDTRRRKAAVEIAAAYLQAGRAEDARRMAELAGGLADTIGEAGDMADLARVFSLLQDEANAQKHYERFVLMVQANGCWPCRRDMFVEAGHAFLKTGVLGFAAASFKAADDPVSTLPMLISVAQAYLAKGQEEEAHGVLADLLRQTMECTDTSRRVRIIAGVALFCSQQDIPLTQDERQAMSDVLARYVPDYEEPGLAGASRAIRLLYFYEANCPLCAEVKPMLEELKAQFPEAEIRSREKAGSQSYNLLRALGERTGIAAKDRGIVPAVFSAQQGLVARHITPYALKELAESARGLPAPWIVTSAELAQGEQDWKEQYRSLTALAVIAAGLGDGINPCAFAVIIFFISYMAFAGKTKAEMARAGLLYTTAVFVTYLAIGLCLYGLLGELVEKGGPVDVGLNIVIAAVVLLACLLSIRDGIRCMQGRVDEVSLKLPEKFKSRIRRLMTTRTRAGLSAAGALSLGALVGLIEFPCTGQVYLPIIQALRELQGEFLPAARWLLLYNLCFIAPLLLVFVMLMVGISVGALTGIYQRHLAGTKFVMAALFAGLFAWFMLAIF